jgi:hypothetical protein
MLPHILASKLRFVYPNLSLVAVPTQEFIAKPNTRIHKRKNAAVAILDFNKNTPVLD